MNSGSIIVSRDASLSGGSAVRQSNTSVLRITITARDEDFREKTIIAKLNGSALNLKNVSWYNSTTNERITSVLPSMNNGAEQSFTINSSIIVSTFSTVPLEMRADTVHLNSMDVYSISVLKVTGEGMSSLNPIEWTDGLTGPTFIIQ